MLIKNLVDKWASFFPGRTQVSTRKIENPADSELIEKLNYYRSLLSIEDPLSRFLKPHNNASDSRSLEWAESRRCVVDVLDGLQKNGVQLSNALISLSHTPGTAIVVGAEKMQNRIGIGVDLEISSRAISPRTAKAFVFPEDQRCSPHLSALQIWVIKEACYKANPMNQSTVISDYLISQSDGIDHGKLVCSKSPETEFYFRLAETENLLIAFAYAQSMPVSFSL